MNKLALGRALFALFGISRIHIIGCDRSGTTMLHLAMACFKNVALSQSESNVQYPYFRDRIGLALRLAGTSGRKHYVTKRHFGWTRPDQVEELIEWTKLEDIGLIHLVRDPRDVMSSRHAGAARSDTAYVSSARWLESIVAADRIFERLSDHARKLTLRYEDVVLNPLVSQEKIAATFGLFPNPSALPIDRVKDNFERLGIRFEASELAALNGLRNMDARTVWHWRKSGEAPRFETMPPETHARVEQFCAQHGYDQTPDLG